MKKTLSIHLGRQLFVIEEDAYQRLQEYIHKLEVSMENEEGLAEIIEDIEMRIAELLQEYLGTTRNVVTLIDVNSAITSLGEPEEIQEETEGASKQQFSTNETTSEGAKRLFRDEENGMIGGVATGIAAYLNIDPVIVRIIFILFLFLGFGILVYIILWVVVPNAKTPSERLQMHGKPVNIGTLKEEFERGADRIKEQTKAASARVKRSAAHVTKQVNSFARVIAKMTGLFLLSSSIVWILIFSSVVSGLIDVIPMTGDDYYYSIFEFISLIVPTGKSLTMVWCSTLIVGYATPLLAIAIGIRLLTGKPSYFYRVNLILFPSILFLGICIGILGSIQTARDYEINSEKENLHLTIHTDELQIVELPLLIGNRKVTQHTGLNFITIKNDSIMEEGVHLRYRMSKDSLFHISQRFSAHGIDLTAALERSMHMQHHIHVEGSKLFIDPYYYFPVKDGLRNQEVEIIIEVPEGKKLFVNDLETRVSDKEYIGVLYPNKRIRLYED